MGLFDTVHGALAEPATEGKIADYFKRTPENICSCCGARRAPGGSHAMVDEGRFSMCAKCSDLFYIVRDNPDELEPKKRLVNRMRHPADGFKEWLDGKLHIFADLEEAENSEKSAAAESYREMSPSQFLAAYESMTELRAYDNMSAADIMAMEAEELHQQLEDTLAQNDGVGLSEGSDPTADIEAATQLLAGIEDGDDDDNPWAGPDDRLDGSDNIENLMATPQDKENAANAGVIEGWIGELKNRNLKQVTPINDVKYEKFHSMKDLLASDSNQGIVSHILVKVDPCGQDNLFEAKDAAIKCQKIVDSAARVQKQLIRGVQSGEIDLAVDEDSRGEFGKDINICGVRIFPGPTGATTFDAEFVFKDAMVPGHLIFVEYSVQTNKISHTSLNG